MRTKSFTLFLVLILLGGCVVVVPSKESTVTIPKGSYLESRIELLDAKIADLRMQDWPDYTTFKRLLKGDAIYSNYATFDLHLWPSLGKDGIEYRLQEQDYRRLEATTGSLIKITYSIEKYKGRANFSQAVLKFKRDKMPMEYRENLLSSVEAFFEKETQ